MGFYSGGFCEIGAFLIKLGLVNGFNVGFRMIKPILVLNFRLYLASYFYTLFSDKIAFTSVFCEI